MALSAGSRVGPYEILGPLGEGGMGTVYRARDTRLDRVAALKILPDEFATSSDRLMRFEREAKTLAALNHPNIAQVYGLEVSGPAGQPELRAIAMELVDGSDLSALPAALSAHDALRIARQIAEGLEAAHDAGVVHRDLKPANIRLRADGAVKILDFGLAKPTTDSSASHHSPTITSAGTADGMILGTAAYMSPEQAKGYAIDKRTDIWAFGVVLFELLTGRRLFAADTVTETLAAVLTRSIEFNALPAAVPPQIRDLLARCLERDPKRRLRDIGEARLVIDNVMNGRAAEPRETGANARSRSRWLQAGAFGVLGLAVGGGIVAGLNPSASSEPRPELRLDLSTPNVADPFSFSLSADGRQLAFVAVDRGMPRLWVRNLVSGATRVLDGTDAPAFPFWSPDGRSIGFFADGKIKRLDLDGGRPTILGDATSPRGASWGWTNTILFVPNVGGISSVAAAGGPVKDVTTRVAGETHRDPQWLPDGRRFLYFVQSGVPERRGVYLATTEQPEGHRLLIADSGAAFQEPRSIFFVREGTLFSQGLNGDALEGAAVPVARDVAVDSVVSSKGAFAISAGVIAYRSGLAERRLAWIDPNSGATETVPLPFDASATSPDVSPDGRHIVLRRTVQGNDDLWLVDLARSALTRFTTDPGQEAFPLWSPDGRQIAFRSNRAGAFAIFVKPSSGEASETLLLQSPVDLLASDWSRDSRWLVYYTRETRTNRDLWAVPMTGAAPGKPEVILQSEFDEAVGRLSNDGRWIAYQTNESGTYEVAIRPFRRPGGAIAVSSGGGVQPRWSVDGRTLYYVTLDGRLMAANITIRGETIDTARASPISNRRIPLVANVFQSPYDIGPDGRLLAVFLPEDQPDLPSVTLLLNWQGK